MITGTKLQQTCNIDNDPSLFTNVAQLKNSTVPSIETSYHVTECT